MNFIDTYFGNARDDNIYLIKLNSRLNHKLNSRLTTDSIGIPLTQLVCAALSPLLYNMGYVKCS